MYRAAIVTTLLLALGASVGELSAQRPAGPAPGQLVDVGGHSLHVRCMGPAGAAPAVTLEAGAGDYSAVWSRVQELLSPRVRTCAYDRASWGWSEPGPAPRSMTQEAFELRALLDSAGMSGPYVMVGHSYGGLLVRRFIERYGDDVSGHRIHVDNPELVAVAFSRPQH